MSTVAVRIVGAPPRGMKRSRIFSVARTGKERNKERKGRLVRLGQWRFRYRNLENGCRPGKIFAASNDNRALVALDGDTIFVFRPTNLFSLLHAFQQS